MVTISGSSVGREAELLRRQIARFEVDHAPLRVEIRPTPDAADDRHQLYVQWLNARAPIPDVLQLDIVWTAEFAAAGWILDLDRFGGSREDFFPSAIAAASWNGRTYARPWFVDVGMLYWRTDLMAAAPGTFADLDRIAARAVQDGAVPYGLVWQGARYEGLVTVFLEYLSAFGGAILDAHGRVAVDSDAAVRALTEMRTEIASKVVPADVLSWQEEQTRFAFQNGQAAFMRNWPYARTLLGDAHDSAVAGRVGVAPMPAGAGGAASGTLGGSTLAINAHSAHPDRAYALAQYLTDPRQMAERARVVGQFPPRARLYDDPAVEASLGIDPAVARRIVSGAVPRPVTPVYAELSGILQVHLHAVLSGQEEPAAGLRAAASGIRALLERSGLAGTT
jgi:multiple sugar transport system substrate-binding protein